MTTAAVIRLRIEVTAHCCMLPSSYPRRLNDVAVELVLDNESGVEVVEDRALRSDDVEEDKRSWCIVVVLSSSMSTLGADMLATEMAKVPDSVNACSMCIMTALTSLRSLEASAASTSFPVVLTATGMFPGT